MTFLDYPGDDEPRITGHPPDPDGPDGELRTETELDELLDMLAEYHADDLPYVDVWFQQPVWHDDGSSSWERVPQGIWGVRTPTLDGRDAIVGSSAKPFPDEWQTIMRCRNHVPYVTLGPTAPYTDTEPF